MEELENVPAQWEIKKLAEAVPDLRIRALFIFSYLTAGRVSEIVRKVQKKDINFIKVNDRDIMLIHMPNEKHRDRKYKDIPIPIDKEGELVSIVKSYLNGLGDEDILFPFSRKSAWKYLTKLGFKPHQMRKIRLTHLVTIYDLNEQLLIQYAGWTDSRPAKHYMQLKWKDLLQKL